MRQNLDKEEQAIINYLSEHNDWSWLKDLSQYFSKNTGLKGRSTLNKVLIRLQKKDIIFRNKSYGKEAVVQLVRNNPDLEVFDRLIRDLATLFEEFKLTYNNPEFDKTNQSAFAIRLAHVLFFVRFESSIIEARLVPAQRADSLEVASKTEVLFRELTDFMNNKLTDDFELARIFARQMPPIIGPDLVAMRQFLNAIKSSAFSPRRTKETAKKP